MFMCYVYTSSITLLVEVYLEISGANIDFFCSKYLN